MIKEDADSRKEVTNNRYKLEQNDIMNEINQVIRINDKSWNEHNPRNNRNKKDNIAPSLKALIIRQKS